MRRHHHRRGGDDVDVVEVRRGGVRRGEEPQAPAQIVARRKAFGILECRRIDRIDGAKPIRQFAIEKGAQLDRGYTAFGENGKSLARFR